MKIVTFSWFDASNEPIHIDKPIICCTNKDKLMTLKDTIGRTCGPIVDGKMTYKEYSNWSWIRDKYNIKYWAYQENLID